MNDNDNDIILFALQNEIFKESKKNCLIWDKKCQQNSEINTCSITFDVYATIEWFIPELTFYVR